MALDYAVVLISSVIIILYVIALFLLTNIRKRLDGKAKISFTFFIITVTLLIIRRLQQVFITSNILNPVAYAPDIMTLFLAISLFLSIFYFYQAVLRAHAEQKLKGFRKKGFENKDYAKIKPQKKFPQKTEDGYLDLTR